MGLIYPKLKFDLQQQQQQQQQQVFVVALLPFSSSNHSKQGVQVVLEVRGVLGARLVLVHR